MTAAVPGLSNYPLRIVPIAQKVIAAASISGTYTVVGSIFSAPVVMIMIVSTLDQPVQLSWDGVTDAIPLVAGGLLVMDFKTNQAVFPGNLGVYVKEIGNPANGSLYVGAFTV
jgi:hypothetical protein